MVGFGKHQGLSVEKLVLQEPGYVSWMLSQPAPTGPMGPASDEARSLVAVFDDKPFAARCCGEGCANRATRCVLYVGTSDFTLWCDHCDPYSLGADPGKLTLIRGYYDAINYVMTWCGNRKSSLGLLIRDLARAKGLPLRVGPEQAHAFFASGLPARETCVRPEHDSQRFGW